MAAFVAHVADPNAATTVTGAVSALEDVRRIESWAAWAKHRLAAAAVQAAKGEHERWLMTSTVDADDRPGLARAERMAVGERSGIAEVACALHVSEGAVHALVTRAETLTGCLPRTSTALRAGAISATAGMLIADAAREYAEELPSASDEATVDCLTMAIEATESGLLHAAICGRTKAELEARARRLRERCHPSSFTERERAARAERYVRISTDRDGMARLSALLPAAVAYRIDGRLSALARTVQAAIAAGDESQGASIDAEPVGDVVPDVPTIGQLRADVLAALAAGFPHPDGDREAARRAGRDTSPGAAVASAAAGWDGVDPVPRVLLTVPAETLLGGDEPGWLGAFGPIPAADARDLAARATSFMLGVTADDQPPAGENNDAGDERTGTVDGGPAARVVPVLMTDGAQYRLPVAVRRALAVRDGTCRFPGCRRSAARCDVDHVVAWADGGSSVPENLAHLCRKHHVLKHHSGWSVNVGPPGNATEGSPPDASARLIWTSPTGRRYTTEPDDPPPF
ncbi:DUF222 domain-containing protein [Tersicoccus sp. MR15.9]|uniref:HNH endonuclease signature motif containing protein n=1 Tax=Tersicoccus mangrovi TaxID=3121635 RepID=UPI002FE550EB